MTRRGLAEAPEHEDAPQRRMSGIFIPPQPQILVDLQMEQLMPDPDLNAITRLINADPGLAGSVLKAANSHLRQAGEEKIASITRAAELLGIDAVINIINGLSIKGQLEDEQIQSLNVFWDTANDVANAAALIARQLGVDQPDNAYMLGLFHNCGMVLMMNARDNYTEVVREAYATSGRRVIDVENDHFRTNHAVLGYYTAKSWHLPLPICQIIADHHSAESIFCTSAYGDYGAENKTLLGILKMAEHICRLHERIGEHAQDIEWDMVQGPILEYLGMSEYDFETLLDAVRDQL